MLIIAGRGIDGKYIGSLNLHRWLSLYREPKANLLCAEDVAA